MLRERYKELEEKEIALYHSCEETVKKVQEGDGEALGIITDVASESSTQAMAAQTVQRFGRIDTLVNNAALLLHYVASKAWCLHSHGRSRESWRVRESSLT